MATTGKVTADLYTPSLTIEDGAFFEGRCAMERPADLAFSGSRSQAIPPRLPRPGVVEPIR